MEILRKNPPREKLPPGRQPKWTAEFMVMVAQKVVDEGMTFRAAAKLFGVSQGSVNLWVKNFRKGNLAAFRGSAEVLSNSHQVLQLEDQIRGLKCEIGDLFLQNLMLKKALFHSRKKKLESSSVITSENLEQFQKDVK